MFIVSLNFFDEIFQRKFILWYKVLFVGTLTKAEKIVEFSKLFLKKVIMRHK